MNGRFEVIVDPVPKVVSAEAGAALRGWPSVLKTSSNMKSSISNDQSAKVNKTREFTFIKTDILRVIKSQVSSTQNQK